jgi:hypothetical protein
MFSFGLRALLLAGGASALVLSLCTPAGAQQGYVPNFQAGPTGWTHPFGGAFPTVQGSAIPVTNDPAHPYVPNGRGIQPTYRVGDLSNPNLTQWAKDIMKKDNDEVIAGKIAYTPGPILQAGGRSRLSAARGPDRFPPDAHESRYAGGSEPACAARLSRPAPFGQCQTLLAWGIRRPL